MQTTVTHNIETFNVTKRIFNIGERLCHIKENFIRGGISASVMIVTAQRTATVRHNLECLHHSIGIRTSHLSRNINNSHSTN